MSDALEFAIWKAINEGASRDLARQQAAAAELKSLLSARDAALRSLVEAAEALVRLLDDEHLLPGQWDSVRAVETAAASARSALPVDGKEPTR